MQEEALRRLEEKAKRCLQEGNPNLEEFLTRLENLEAELVEEEAACTASGFGHQAVRKTIEHAIDEVQVAA